MAVVLAVALMAVVTVLAPVRVIGLGTSGGADDGVGPSWYWAAVVVALLVLVVVVGAGGGSGCSGCWWW